MRITRHVRPDGRYVCLYSFDASPPAILPAGPPARADDRVELRWNALLDEHVIVSTGRQGRTFLPPDEHCPLCPSDPSAANPTEIPAAAFEIAVFENRFPSFRPDAPAVSDESPLARRAPAVGVCEVVVYSPDHDGSLASLGDAGVQRLVDVWADRYAELAARPDVDYVFIFENRGTEIGVTLTHPHGQIYAFPFLPPRVEQEDRAAAEHHRRTGHCLLCDIAAAELQHRDRVVAEEDGFVAWVPFAARFPYEIHVAPVMHRPSLLLLSGGQRQRFARLLRTVQRTYDNLWGRPMPYTMSIHQRAADGVPRPGEHLHAEFMPPYRTKDKLKYLAGVESGAGTFINDTAPEEKARELREALPRT
ncbi:MAG TPA: galactose-1-phosphate uridylyltransferase [Dehalococcoidia bacterium]|nr:galactose-1-phosphate uridylyltransferase [Dehalococcoidia bacterium]